MKTSDAPLAPPDAAYHPLSVEWCQGLLELLKALTARGEHCFFHPHPFDRGVIEQLAHRQGRDIYMVQTVKETVAGYGMLRGWDEGYEVPSLGIAIHPAYRGFGLGRAFMMFLHDLAGENGAEMIRLTVYPENTAALRLYEQLGYVFAAGQDGRMEGYFSFAGEQL